MGRSFRIVVVVFLVAAAAAGKLRADSYGDERSAMVSTIAALADQTARETGRPVFAERVMQALAEVPRHEFVPLVLRPLAYANRPLPIGHGQTISQPYIVALMTDLIDPQAGDVMLEIGTGSGYQAAVLSKLVEHVYTIEIVEALGVQAAGRLAGNVTAKVGDGYFGWTEHGPFDGILVTAAASHIPPPLVAQLKPGGSIIIPVGERFQIQFLTIVERALDGSLSTRSILPVSFVPLTGGGRGQ